MNRPTRLAALGVLAALALTACGGSPVLAGSAAVIGDRRISSEQLASIVSTGLADPAAAQLAADRPAYQRDVLGRLITGEVVEVAASRRGVQVTPGQVDAQYAAIEQSVGGASQLREQAAAAGLALDKVRDLARTRALTTQLGDALTADVQVPAGQLEQAYTQGIDNYDKVRTAQVVLPTIADAQALLPQARLLDDAAFAELARTRSIDDATKAQGGDLGLQSRGSLTTNGLDAYATAAFAAKVGDTFAVASAQGGHVVRVLERRTTTLADATPELRRAVLQDQRDQAVQALLVATERSLHVRVNPRFGTWDGASLAVVARSEVGQHEVSSPEAPAGGSGGGEPEPQPTDGAQPSEAPAPTPELIPPESVDPAPADPTTTPSAPAAQ